MNNLCIEATDCTPRIWFDSTLNVLEISGTSCPKNTAEFYAPVLFWMGEYVHSTSPERITVNIAPVKFSKNSWKVMIGFFEMLDAAAAKKRSIAVNWVYNKDDKEILQQGTEFQRKYPRLAFRLISDENGEDK